MTQLKGTKCTARDFAKRIRDGIKNHELLPGDRLESVRTLSSRFKVGRGIVFTAIESLKKEGLLESHGRTGIFVAKEPGPDPNKRVRIGFYYNYPTVSAYTYSMLHALSMNGMARFEDIVFGCRNQNVSLTRWANGLDALLVTGRVDDELVRTLKELQIPFIIIGNYDLTEECNIMEINEADALCMALRESWEKLRFQSFGMVVHSPALPAVKRIIASIRELQKELPFRFSEDDLIFDAAENGYNSFKIIMKRPESMRPDLVFLSHQSVFGAARYIYENGLKCADRPLILSKIQENMIPFLPGLPDIVQLDDNSSSFANEMLNWIEELLQSNIPPPPEKRISKIAQKVLFN